MCEVEGVTVDFLRVGESACDESSYKARWNGNAESDGDRSKLDSSLVVRAPIGTFDKNSSALFETSEVELGSTAANGRNESAEHAWKAVKVKNSASVMKTDLLLQPLVQKQKAECRQHASNNTCQHGKAWTSNKITAGSHNNTTR